MFKLTHVRRTIVLLVLTTVPYVVWAATPDAIDDAFTTPKGISLDSENLAANDVDLNDSADTFTLVSLPSNGTATVTPEGLLSYTPNVGFAGSELFTYQINDGSGGIDTANISIDVTLSSDYLSSNSPTVIGLENTDIPLGLIADPDLYLGGPLQDLIDTDTLFRPNNANSTPVTSAIPENATDIKVTGYSTRNTNTNQVDTYNDDYQLLNFRVNLRTGTTSGQLVHVVETKTGKLDQFSWSEVPLGQAVLSDTSRITGEFTGVSNPLISLIAGEIHIVETHTLETAYLIEYTSTENVSASFLKTDIAVQVLNETTSTFSIPAQLVPSDGPKGFVVLSGNSAANGNNSNQEYKGVSRYLVDLESQLVSGLVAVEYGETEARTVTWAFKDYPLIDLRNGSNNKVSVQSSTAVIIGDTIGDDQIQSDPTIYISAAGELTIERATSFAAGFTSIYTSEDYQRHSYSSIATIVASESDNTLFDTNAQSPNDANGKPVNIQRFDIPTSASVGLINMSWNTIGGTTINENIGFGFAIIDLTTETSSGSIIFSRATTPDLLAWGGVELGATMFGAVDSNSNPLYESNKVAGKFVDGFPESARFTIVTNANGSRVLEFTATAPGGTKTFQDYLGNAQVSWLGNEPLRISGIPEGGTLSHGSPLDADTWELNPTDIPLLKLRPDENSSGSVQVDLTLSSTGEIESVLVFVEPVANIFPLSASDSSGLLGNSIPLQISVGDSTDIDGSESVTDALILSGVPTDVTLSSSAGTVTNLGSGEWSVNRASLPTLAATGTASGISTITVTATNVDEFDIDNDQVIEDGNNGDGADERNTRVSTKTFELTRRETPTVVAQEVTDGDSETSRLSGNASLLSGDTFSVMIDSITYTVGDGKLNVNNNGTWDLDFPTPEAVGVYEVTATITYSDGNSASDTSTDEFTVGSSDIDGDGIPNSQEGSGDFDGDGIPDAEDPDSDNDGIPDASEGPGDSDGDGVPDYRDNDSDNDGIADADEGTGDSDQDGTPDYLDTDSDNDGIADADEGTGDSDQDGTPDYLDTDSDNDGITDAIEGTNDSDLDGTPDYLDIDSDNDGIADAIEGALDSDVDGVPNYLDLDTDNDGIPDTLESTLDSDLDGVPNYLDLDSDNDGVADIVEVLAADIDNDYRIDNFVDDNNNGLSDELETLPFDITDTDSDRVPDYLDLDSDQDGVTDLLESGGVDDDHDGRIDEFSDLNGDGADDAHQASVAAGRDSDEDGMPNRLDSDSDGDGLADLVEAGTTNGAVNPMQDSDSDGIPDSVDVDLTAGNDDDLDGIDDAFDADFVATADTDSDGIVDSADPDANGDGFSDNASTDTRDSDVDGVPDYLDTDSDNDNIPDALEGNSDSDLDGVPDNLDTDSDNDGVPDASEGSGDSDLDGIPDYLDTDSDNDGVPDASEGSGDSDNDGIPDNIDTDSDNDGVPDTVEGTGDSDLDGIPDYIDTDSDNDGVLDASEGSGDSDLDGIPDYLDSDSDNDGIADAEEGALDNDRDGLPNYLDLDSENDGIPDSLETTRDNDLDGKPNYLDLDSDNDGIPDIIEVFGTDIDNDYRIDNFIDQQFNGLSDELDTLPFDIVDTDNDRIPDYLDLDSDQDGVTDLLESGGIDDDNDGRIDGFSDLNDDGADDANQATVAAGRDIDGDGIPNRLDIDSDNDGLPDVVEAGASDNESDGTVDPMQDSDSDGIPDSVDVDLTFGSDDDLDGIDDAYDVDYVFADDTDGDGIIDSADPDANGDGLSDNPGNALSLGSTLPDLNGNNVADVFESGLDGVFHTGLAGHGCSIDSARVTHSPLFALMLLTGFIGVARRFVQSYLTKN